MSRNDTLIQALGTILTLQRWNFLPRIETWVEAENAVYATHVAYVLARVHKMPVDSLLALMHRSLLRSLSKHFTTDIPITIRDHIREKDESAWRKLVDRNAARTAAMFPRELSGRIRSFLTDKPTYSLGSAVEAGTARKEAEELLLYAHNRVAAEECRINQNIFTSEYGHILQDIEKRIAAVPDHKEYDKTYKKLQEYFVTIKRLKYLRRWNSINRVNPSSVLAHTYLVAVLAIVLCWLEEKQIRSIGADWTQFQYRVVLRALFHDLPESLTGDVITPVKDQIAAINDTIWPWIEEHHTKEFVGEAPAPVREDIETIGLLKELEATEPYSVNSLVKDCDRLALMLECAYERESGRMRPEMMGAFDNYVSELRKSEWRAVREFVATIPAEFPGA